MGVHSHRRSVDIATVVSRVLRALSIFAPVTLLDAPATLAQSLEPISLVADIPAQAVLSDLIVSAHRRGEELHYVPNAIRELTCDVPAELHTTTDEDALPYLP